MNVFKYRANKEIEGKYRDTDSLLSHQYYASKMADLNDPFEGEFDEAISDLVRLFKELENTDSIEKSWNSIKEFKSVLGVFSIELKEKTNIFPVNELLWAHYSDSHKGFCIEYDIDKIISSYSPFYELNKVKVDYDINCPKVLIEDITQKQVILQKMYGTKSLPWNYESEFRLIFDNAGIKTYHPSALKNIYFGLNMDEKRQEDIINGLLGNDVVFYKMKKIGRTYNLKAEIICESNRIIDGRLNKAEYKILKETHQQTVENFHILLKINDYSNEYLKNFIVKFREEFATKQSNIFFYDDENVTKLIDIYPLVGQDNEFFSNHLVAQSTFDSNNYIWKYPLK